MIRLDNIADENIELVELDMKYLEDMFEYSVTQDYMNTLNFFLIKELKKQRSI
jgi:hypothetical protein